MYLLEFLRKNIKAVTITTGLLLVCIGMVLSLGSIEKNADDATELPVKLQTEPLSGQGTDLASEPMAEPQAGSSEESKSVEEAEPVLTGEYELVYEGISVFNSGSAGTYFKYDDKYADLYMRKLSDSAGEYIELSLWSEQKEIWHTVNRDHAEEYPLFWMEDSEHLTLNQKSCYYVVEVDGTAYLMRYCVEMASDVVTMSYKVFGISTINLPGYFLGSEAPFDIGSISLYLVSNDVIAPVVYFPIEQMIDFADTVKGYMENGCLVASSLQGVFEVEASADRDNPIFPYMYDIFPWIPELVTEQNVNMEGIHSLEKLFTVLQNTLPTGTAVIMPDVMDDESCFITGDYYGDSDESYLTVRMKENGFYGGTLLIDNALNTDFTGYYNDGILTVTEIIDYPEQIPCEMEISFMNGKATVMITAASEWNIVEVGDVFLLDRNEKPKELEYLRNAENYPARE